MPIFHYLLLLWIDSSLLPIFLFKQIVFLVLKCTLATSCKELTHWKRLWCWEGLGAGGEGDDRGWDGWMASLTQWMWVWVNSGSWWWTGRPGVLWFMGSQRVGHDWATELNWTDSRRKNVNCLNWPTNTHRQTDRQTHTHTQTPTWSVFRFCLDTPAPQWLTVCSVHMEWSRTTRAF